MKILRYGLELNDLILTILLFEPIIDLTFSTQEPKHLKMVPSDELVGSIFTHEMMTGRKKRKGSLLKPHHRGTILSLRGDNLTSLTLEFKAFIR